MKPHILVVSEFWPPDPGGMATYAAEIIPRLGKMGFEITLLIPENKKLQRIEANSQNVRAYFFPSPPIHFLGRFTIFPALLFHGNLRKISAIVDISVAPYGGVTSKFAKLLKVPHIIGAHGNEVSRLYPGLGMSRTFRNYCISAYRNAAVIVPNSSFTASLFEPFEVEKSRIKVITLGANVDFYTPGSPTEEELSAVAGKASFPRLLCAAQLNKTKGQEGLIRALPAIIEQFPETSLDIAGSGPLLSFYQKLANELNISDRIRFHGHLTPTKLRTLFRICDVTVLPTPRDSIHNEGFGLVAAEALACGCPVAASDYGGQTEFIKNGKTGILFDAKNPVAIADAVANILRDTSLRNSIKTTGPEVIARNYTWDLAAERWGTLLEQVIAGSSRRKK